MRVLVKNTRQSKRIVLCSDPTSSTTTRKPTVLRKKTKISHHHILFLYPLKRKPHELLTEGSFILFFTFFKLRYAMSGRTTPVSNEKASEV
jgi:hypothetical protein